jgi:hypothetical protein
MALFFGTKYLGLAKAYCLEVDHKFMSGCRSARQLWDSQLTQNLGLSCPAARRRFSLDHVQTQLQQYSLHQTVSRHWSKKV